MLWVVWLRMEEELQMNVDTETGQKARESLDIGLPKTAARKTQGTNRDMLETLSDWRHRGIEGDRKQENRTWHTRYGCWGS